jgi:hypothetical protein
MGKRVAAMALAAVLPVLAVAPAEAHWHGGFWFGVGTGTLLTAPLWYPYGYRAPYYYYPYAPSYPYAAPYYYPYYQPYPVYVAPVPSAGSPPPAEMPATPTTPTPSPLTPSSPGTGPASPPAASQGPAGQTCTAVWVEAHYETHIRTDGQATTVWIPAASQQICR